MTSAASLSEARASRLALRATRRRRDGSRAILARLAWHRLSQAADHGSQAAIGAVWLAWQGEPDDELWQALGRWRMPDVLAEDACSAAVEPGLPEGMRAAIGRFCARHRLVPGDDIQRSLFYVLTGQAAQHAADDPDGSRLAIGYQGAGEQTRTMLRQAITSSGTLDLARVLGIRGEGRRALDLNAREAADLARELASRRDWPALWRLAQGLPLAEAVLAMRWFGDSWQPGDDRHRPLFSLLSQADAAGITRARDALLGPVAVHIDMEGYAYGVSFSPDGRQLLVATVRDGDHARYGVYHLPDGELSERHGARHMIPSDVLHLGEAFYAVEGLPLGGRDDLVRHDAGGRVVIDSATHMKVFRHPAGFITQKPRTPFDPRHLTTLLRDAHGNDIRDVVSVPGQIVDPHLEVVDPRTGRAVLRQGVHRWLTDGDCTRVVARLPVHTEEPASIVFPGPNRLAVIYRRGGAELCRLTGDRLSLEARVSVPEGVRSVEMLDGEVAALSGSRGLAYLSETLALVTKPRLLAGASGARLRGSDDGRCLALYGSPDGHTFADVICRNDPAVTSLASRPMAEMNPADLAAVEAALRSPVPGALARPFLDLLRQCLEYRFETDAALGEAGWVRSGDDDAGLVAG